MGEIHLTQEALGTISDCTHDWIKYDLYRSYAEQFDERIMYWSNTFENEKAYRVARWGEMPILPVRFLAPGGVSPGGVYIDIGRADLIEGIIVPDSTMSGACVEEEGVEPLHATLISQSQAEIIVKHYVALKNAGIEFGHPIDTGTATDATL